LDRFVALFVYLVVVNFVFRQHIVRTSEAPGASARDLQCTFRRSHPKQLTRVHFVWQTWTPGP
jgi:hypothetical protein